jgi:hypothetical protein
MPKPDPSAEQLQEIADELVALSRRLKDLPVVTTETRRGTTLLGVAEKLAALATIVKAAH